MTDRRWDVLVVGAGTAGMPCAIEAAERGARVCVVEKRPEIGGTMHVSGGHMSAGGTRRQREQGIVDSPAGHLDDLLRLTRGTVDRDLARLAVEEAPRTVDWLDELGFPFEAGTPRIVYGHEPYGVPRTYWGPGAARDILETLRPLWDRHVESGAITPLLGHALEELIVEDGAVVGVRVRAGDETRELRAAAVALTSGGYAANADMFAQRSGVPFPLVSVAPAASTGDGILAAERIGAGFRGGEHQLPTATGIELPRGSGRADLWEAWPELLSTERRPREIYVGADGHRFINEDDLSPDHRERVIHDLPGAQWWVVFDEASIDAGLPLVPQWGGAGLRRKAGEGDVVWVADDLRTLALRAGIDPHGLMRTVSEFNASVRSGHDRLGRTSLQQGIGAPPYYALLNTATTFITFGGLTVDADLRVLDGDGAPIAGLYAAGEIIGASATSGNAFCGGMLVTPALGFGRRAGRAIAAEAAGAVGPDAELRDVAARVLDVAGAVSSALVIGENDNADIWFAAGAGPLAGGVTGARGPALGSGLSGTVLAGDCSVLSKDTAGDDRIHQGHTTEMGITTALGVPLRREGRPFAMLMALNRSDGTPFDEADEQALMRFADEVADAVWDRRAAA